MLRIYTRKDQQLVPVQEIPTGGVVPVWLDLVSPTADEDRQVEELLGISIPSRDEMEEIELSARLYTEAGAEFMTMTGLANLDTDTPIKTPLTFILKGETLVTVRYAEPKPFIAFSHRAQRPDGAPCASGEQVMIGLIEAMIDRTADALERIGNDIDGISRQVFQKSTQKANKKTRDLQAVLDAIGHKTELLTMVQESLVSVSRLTAYHAAIEPENERSNHQSRQLIKLIQRDAVSLGEHARALNARLNFLLDASLGMINLEQNQIIKIFSVAAVVFLPPTLVASIYGMNFDFMPELGWQVGYPWAIGLMILSAILPFAYFKRRGWL